MVPYRKRNIEIAFVHYVRMIIRKITSNDETFRNRLTPIHANVLFQIYVTVNVQLRTLSEYVRSIFDFLKKY